ncbi:MAG: rhamnulokinase, partial [Muribaculaceae bacterium]|nr:rhamnulokinase [Muribaculaceae bacterium]
IMDINTLYRLVDMKESAPDMLAMAHRLLFMPDLFSYFLTGKACNEYTIASTSELIDVNTREWNRALIKRVGLPEHIFGEIVMPGEMRGRLTKEVKCELGIDYDVDVVAVGSHDTASAAYSVTGTYDIDGTAFLSSGTWSLLGVILDAPVATEKARLAGFTNEGAVGGKIKFLQNITGLWILQSLMAVWHAEGLPTDYGHLLSEAEKANIDTVIDVDDPVFTVPSHMDRTIREYCKAHGLKAPETQGETVRCVLQSLAVRYKRGIDEMNSMLPHPIKRLQIIGGGSRNSLLNRLTQEATGLTVDAGPVEATAIGNVLLQAKVCGKVLDVSDIAYIIFK